MAKKRIVFIGGGAVGAYVAAHLVRGGEDVTVFDPWPENVAAINAKGIEVTGTTEQEHFIQAVDTRPLSEIGQLWQEAPVDIAFVCMKSYDTEWATSMIAPYLAPDGFVVSLQNCSENVPILAEAVSGKRPGKFSQLRLGCSSQEYYWEYYPEYEKER